MIKRHDCGVSLLDMRPPTIHSNAAQSASRRGAALLEVLAALTVLAVAGVSAVGAVAQATHSASQAIAAERRTREASRFLEAVSLWTREELDQRLGERPQGPWRLHIGRTTPTLYAVTLADSAAPMRPLLRTSLYRSRTVVRQGGANVPF